jgi:hypothetical protein
VPFRSLTVFAALRLLRMILYIVSLILAHVFILGPKPNGSRAQRASPLPRLRTEYRHVIQKRPSADDILAPCPSVPAAASSRLWTS